MLTTYKPNERAWIMVVTIKFLAIFSFIITVIVTFFLWFIYSKSYFLTKCSNTSPWLSSWSRISSFGFGYCSCHFRESSSQIWNISWWCSVNIGQICGQLLLWVSDCWFCFPYVSTSLPLPLLRYRAVGSVRCGGLRLGFLHPVLSRERALWQMTQSLLKV